MFDFCWSADSVDFKKPIYGKGSLSSFLRNKIHKSYFVPGVNGEFRKKVESYLNRFGTFSAKLKNRHTGKYTKVIFTRNEKHPVFQETPYYPNRMKSINNSKNVETAGQVFTPDDAVKKILLLRKNKGSILEPSAGDGAFSKFISKEKEFVGIEKDETKCPGDCICMDFFDYHTDSKFNTIVGNPPYVKGKSIDHNTKLKLTDQLCNFNDKANLYLFFIEKCIYHLNDGGELIFITPREFLKATSSIKLNQFIYDSGTITDIIDLGDRKIFPNFNPNCIIFRFEKDNFSRKTNIIHFDDMSVIETKNFVIEEGQLLFIDNNKYNVKFSDIFSVHVGGVSGLDRIFINENGNEDFVFSKTFETKETRKMFYGIKNEYLENNKEELINRKIKKFDERNWFEWGRDFKHSDNERIYVNCKTRKNNPFFTHDCKNYDGSMLAIFFKNKDNENKIEEAINDLNNVDWKELGFMCNNRFIFSQKSLENICLPENFKKYI